MILISNSIKKGIEIPYIDITIDNDTAEIEAIDKLKYADFLELNPQIVFIDTLPDEGYALSTALRVVDYTGDAVTTNIQGTIKGYYISVESMQFV